MDESQDVWPGSPPTTGGNPYTGSSGYPCSFVTVNQAFAMSSQTQKDSPRNPWDVFYQSDY
jgi:hypothetical protein